jgi:Family of unknown function (DUF6064)
MSAWWTYRPSDWLMFSEHTYRRLFELYNAEAWPLHGLALLAGLGLLGVGLRLHGPRAPREGAGSAAASQAGPSDAAVRGALLLLALGWCAVAWAFHWQRFADIHTAAPWFAGAFVAEALLLAACAAWRQPRAQVLPRRAAVRSGLGVLLLALVGLPLSGLLAGRPVTQAEVFGLAPDPTALATLGVLLLLPRGAAWLWPIPVLWCLFSGLTLWTLQAPDAWLTPLAATLAVLAGCCWRR